MQHYAIYSSLCKCIKPPSTSIPDYSKKQKPPEKSESHPPETFVTPPVTPGSKNMRGTTSPISMAQIGILSNKRYPTTMGGKQPTPQCRQEVRSQNSSRAKGSPIISHKPWCSMTSPQGGSFGNPFADGGTHNLRKGETARTGGSGATNKKGCGKQPRTPSPHTKVPRAQLDRPNVDYSKLSRHGSQLKNLQCSANSRLSVAKGSRNKNVRRQVSKGKLLGNSSAPNLISQEHRTSVANQRRSTINATPNIKYGMETN